MTSANHECRSLWWSGKNSNHHCREKATFLRTLLVHASSRNLSTKPYYRILFRERELWAPSLKYTDQQGKAMEDCELWNRFMMDVRPRLALKENERKIRINLKCLEFIFFIRKIFPQIYTISLSKGWGVQETYKNV